MRNAVVALWTECGLTRPWNDPHRDIARKLGEQPELFSVAASEGTVVGSCMAGFDGHRGWIHYLAVSPAAQGKGVGRALVAHAEHALESRGCPKVQLMIRPDNGGVANFYEALGYESVETRVLGKRLIADD